MAPYINDLRLKKEILIQGLKKRDFDTRVEMEVQKATSAMKIEMTEKMYEAKKEMEAMDKKLLEAKEEAKENNEVMERKLLEAKMDMEEIIADKVKEGIQAYVESLGINIDANLKSKQVPDNPLEDSQQPSLLVPGVHTRKANMIKKTGTTVVGTNKKKIFKEIEVKYRLQHARLLD
uniref:Leucine-rich repeat resistance protein n=1 Tax=Solanum tuberosum TaxID=4113 RepID=M1BFN3_SOLTU